MTEPLPVRVRFAPSPSGDLHVGNIRTALYDLAFARRTGGTFVLRIEDTDQARVTDELGGPALGTLRWLGLDWDEGPEAGGEYGPYQQSQRLGIYADWAAKFLADGHAYHCYCTPGELTERRAAGAPAADAGRIDHVHRPGPGRGQLRSCVRARLRAAAGRRQSAVHARRRGRRRADEDHPCGAG